MSLVRPRLSDYYDLAIPQPECDFAIPLLDEDLPLFVDPFLLWKSPSMQDSALHLGMVTAFDAIIALHSSGSRARAAELLNGLSECDEAGLGLSGTRSGRRMGIDLASEALDVLASIPSISSRGVRHLEVVQLLVAGVGRDRVSDFACSMLKSFLIDFTVEQCRRWSIPTQRVAIPEIFDPQRLVMTREEVALPVAPGTGRAVLFVPKRWLRYAPWISFDQYFEGTFVDGDDVPSERAAVLLYNRANFGMVESFISQREAIAHQCTNDPIFAPISVISAKRRLSAVKKLPTGNKDKADKKYEDLVGSLLASVLHPHLDYASDQVRTASGVLIRDLIFYNTQTWDFLRDLREEYGARQLVFELKNVKALEREHVNQLNRYLSDPIGRFGVLVTRKAASRALRQNLVDLWSGQRKCILVLTDSDLELMVTLFESQQRLPIEVLKRAFVTFSRSLPA